jgi:signal recognition particle subunit SRP54
MEALDVFYPIRMAERILEWEMLCLVERAQEQFEEEEEFKENRQNEFGFDDFHPNSTGKNG